jgi:hypothetical protein
VASDRDRFDCDGAYLDPAWLFTEGVSVELVEPELSEAIMEFGREHGLTIAVEATIDDRELVVTHGSGFFVRATGVIGRDGYGEPERNRDRLDAVRICNLVVCELTLNGLTARPFTPEDLCASLREGSSASIWVAGGLKQVRSWATQSVLRGSADMSVIHWPAADVELLRRSTEPTRALKLAAVSETLPDFVASAVISRHWERPAETLLFSWIVAEQLVNQAWEARIPEVALDPTHRDRLKDSRTYTAAVQTDTLHAIGRITDQASQALSRARSFRNALAHSAKLDDAAATAGLVAMGYAMTELADIELVRTPEEWSELAHE